MNNIIPAIISGLSVAIPTIFVAYIQNNSTKALMTYRINELEKKVDKQNALIERVAVLERDLKTVFNRLEKIEKKEGI